MRNNSLNHQQTGFVSIVVTLIIMIVLSLIVIGFAQLSRREQRQSLDRQLSAQAYYAAESGINDAVRAINTGGYTNNKDQCTTDIPTFGPYGQQLNATAGIGYTCLLIDQRPTAIKYGNIDPDSSQVVPITSVDSSGVPVNIKSLTISWQDKDNGTTFDTTHYPKFPKRTAWNSNTGILQVSLTPIETPAQLTRANLMSNSFDAFLYPATVPPGPVNYSGSSGLSNQGSIISGHCSTAATPAYCNVTINFNVPALQVAHYYLRLKSIYKANTVIISGMNINLKPVQFQGAQAVIDSTGKANDILRRIQVRIPNTSTYHFPQYVLDSVDDICKQLQVYPGAAVTPPPPTPAACTLSP